MSIETVLDSAAVLVFHADICTLLTTSHIQTG